MKTKFIKLFNLEFIKETKWCEIYYSRDFVFIFNKVGGWCKVKHLNNDY